MLPQGGRHEALHHTEHRPARDCTAGATLDGLPCLILVALGQVRIAKAPELFLDDRSVGFVDVLLVEEVLEFVDAFSRVDQGKALPQPSQKEGRESGEKPMTPGTCMSPRMRRSQ